jgi:hypothetical protein
MIEGLHAVQRNLGHESFEAFSWETRPRFGILLTLSPVIGLDELLVRLGTTYIDPDVSSDKLF